MEKLFNFNHSVDYIPIDVAEDGKVTVTVNHETLEPYDSIEAFAHSFATEVCNVPVNSLKHWHIIENNDTYIFTQKAASGALWSDDYEDDDYDEVFETSTKQLIRHIWFGNSSESFVDGSPRLLSHIRTFVTNNPDLVKFILKHDVSVSTANNNPISDDMTQSTLVLSNDDVVSYFYQLATTTLQDAIVTDNFTHTTSQFGYRFVRRCSIDANWFDDGYNAPNNIFPNDQLFEESLLLTMRDYAMDLMTDYYTQLADTYEGIPVTLLDEYLTVVYFNEGSHLFSIETVADFKASIKRTNTLSSLAHVMRGATADTNGLLKPKVYLMTETNPVPQTDVVNENVTVLDLPEIYDADVLTVETALQVVDTNLSDTDYVYKHLSSGRYIIPCVVDLETKKLSNAQHSHDKAVLVDDTAVDEEE